MAIINALPTGGGGSGLPSVTSSDNGKVLEVVSGDWDLGSVKAPVDSPVFTTSISLGRKANTTVGEYSSAIGRDVEASGLRSHAEGDGSKATNNQAHAENNETTASGKFSHAEGDHTTASGQSSHAECLRTTASGDNAHAEGSWTTASGNAAHAEGWYTVAAGRNSHVFGTYNVIDDYTDWPEWVSGTHYYPGDKVKHEYNDGTSTYFDGYICKTENSDETFNGAKWYWLQGRTDFVEVVGNGIVENSYARSNARALDWYGNEYLKGDIYVGCNDDSTGGTKLVAPVGMTGADGTNAGSAGYVPAPAATDNAKFLRGDGTWQNTPTELPAVTGSDNGKVLGVSQGAWAPVEYDTFYRQFWNSTDSATIGLDSGKTFIIWASGSSAGTSGAVMDSTYGALIFASNGEYAVIHKGSSITVAYSSGSITVSTSDSTSIKMGIVQV